MIGLAASPGTAVDPMCSISSGRPASADRISAMAAAARAGQDSSYGTTSTSATWPTYRDRLPGSLDRIVAQITSGPAGLWPCMRSGNTLR